MAIDFAPADVVLLTPPLTDTLGRVEIEVAAALIVRALQVLGRGWGDWLESNELWQVIGAEIEAKREPVTSWVGNPFLRPDFAGLSSRGFVETEEGAPRQGGTPDRMRLTAAAVERLATWVRRTNAPASS